MFSKLFECFKSENEAKYRSIYSRDREGFVFVSKFWREKNTYHFFDKHKSLWTTHLVDFVKINLLELGNIAEIATVYKDRSQTMGYFRNWRFSIFNLFLFYLHLVLILWYPDLSIVMWRRCILCSLRNWKTNVVWEEGGEMLSRRSEIEVYCEVFQHFCRPSVATQFGGHNCHVITMVYKHLQRQAI